ncbi:hypothetical protein [Sphingobacterium paucimobilis]|nr:hypothetical protein [Sphingobacterium paucimobilis]
MGRHREFITSTSYVDPLEREIPTRTEYQYRFSESFRYPRNDLIRLPS